MGNGISPLMFYERWRITKSLLTFWKHFLLSFTFTFSGILCTSVFSLNHNITRILPYGNIWNSGIPDVCLHRHHSRNAGRGSTSNSHEDDKDEASLDRSQPTYLSLYLRQEFLLRKSADLRCCSVQDRLWVCCHGSNLWITPELWYL